MLTPATRMQKPFWPKLVPAGNLNRAHLAHGTYLASKVDTPRRCRTDQVITWLLGSSPRRQRDEDRYWRQKKVELNVSKKEKKRWSQRGSNPRLWRYYIGVLAPHSNQLSYGTVEDVGSREIHNQPHKCPFWVSGYARGHLMQR